MVEKELRAWLKKRLNADGKNFDFGALWRQLEDEAYVSDCTDPDYSEYGKEAFLHTARAKLRGARELLHGSGEDGGGHSQSDAKDDAQTEDRESVPEEREVELNAYEFERALAYAETLAREAALSQGPDGSFPIANWRRRYLGESLLSLEGAHELLESPAARFLPLHLFQRWEVPVADHKAEVLDYDDGVSKPYTDHRATIKVTPPGITKTVCYGSQLEAGFDTAAVDGHWYSHRGGNEADIINPEERVLRYNDRDGLKEDMWVWPGSVLDSLRALGAHWTRVLGWEQEEMTMWLLTGNPPDRRPLRSKIRYKHGSPLTVTLEVHPWVSTDTVANNYRKIQRQLFGKDYRRLGSRSLAVLRFVEKRTRESGGRRPSWSSLMKEWNNQCPAEWSFTDRRNLSRRYKEALDAVAHSSFIMPARQVSPALRRKMERKNAEITRHLLESFGNLVENGYTTRTYDAAGNETSPPEYTPPKPSASRDGRETGNRS